MSADKQTSRFESDLDDIQRLLERQIELAQQGNISDVELLRKQVDSLVAKIVHEGLLESAEFEKRREKLHKLFGDLCLALTDQKADTRAKINLVRRGKKTIKTYRSNM